MTKTRNLIMLILALMVGPILAGCVITTDEAIFKPSSKFDIPNISGAFRANSEHTSDLYVLRRVDGTTNTFILTAADKNTLSLTLEPLKPAKYYLVQISSPSGPEVILSLCAMREPGKVDIYGLKPAKLPELAQKYGITLDNNGHITKMSSAKKLKDFLGAALKDTQYSGKLDTITLGDSKKAK